MKITNNIKVIFQTISNIAHALIQRFTGKSSVTPSETPIHARSSSRPLEESGLTDEWTIVNPKADEPVVEQHATEEKRASESMFIDDSVVELDTDPITGELNIKEDEK